MDPRFAVLGFFMAAGIIIHNCHFGSWVLWTRTTVLSLVAIWTLLRPASVFRVLTLGVVYLGVFVCELPMVVNHSMFLAIVLVTMALATVVAIPRRGDDLGGAIYGLLAPAMRIEVVILYLFATLAKCNSGYFDPSISAAIGVYEGGIARIPGLPAGEPIAGLLIWGSLLIEGGIAVLLAIPRTRILAAVVGVPFHVFLAIAGHAPFSGFVPLLMWPFFADALVPRFRAGLASRPELAQCCRWVATAAARPIAWPIACLFWVVPSAVCSFGCPPDGYGKFLRMAQTGAIYLFMGYAAFLAVGLQVTRQVPSTTPVPRPNQPLRWVTVPGILLLVLNGMCPYLGLKTQSSFTMYSNLRTEGGEWNSLIFPRALQVFSFQDRVVRLLGSSDPVLQRAARNGERWVFFELRRYLHTRPDVAVTFESGGQVRSVPRAGDDPELSRDPGFLARKAFWFRPIRPPGVDRIPH